jgi:hypothetical protein
MKWWARSRLLPIKICDLAFETFPLKNVNQ